MLTFIDHKTVVKISLKITRLEKGHCLVCRAAVPGVEVAASLGQHCIGDASEYHGRANITGVGQAFPYVLRFKTSCVLS